MARPRLKAPPSMLTVPEAFLWPPKCEMTFWGRRCDSIFSKDRKLDIADTLMLDWPGNQRTVFMGLRTDSKRWDRWTETALSRIEALIRHDLQHDGYKLTLTRLSATGTACNEQFDWKLVIRTA